MWPVSDRWGDLLATSHVVQARAEVWRAGSPTGVELGVIDGSVRADETSKTRRQLTLNVADVDLMPSLLGDLLAPVDADLVVYRGMVATDGVLEEVPVFTGRLTSPSTQGVYAALSLPGDDYSGVLARARFVRPWVTPAGSRIVDEIARMVHDVLPWVDVIDLTGSAVRTKIATWDLERWDAIESLASSIGAECYFGPDGGCVLRPVPVVGSQTVADADWVIDSGETSVLLDYGRSMDVSGVYNAVVATSSDTNHPNLTAVAYQSTGPLAWRAGVKFPRFYASPLLATTAQCASAAKAMLARSLAYSVVVSPTVAPNGASDVGDLVALQLPDEASPTLRVLSGFTLPLGLDAMTLMLRTDADPTTGDLT